MQDRYVPIKETIRGFKEILEGKHDNVPESAFLFLWNNRRSTRKS